MGSVESGNIGDAYDVAKNKIASMISPAQSGGAQVFDSPFVSPETYINRKPDDSILRRAGNSIYNAAAETTGSLTSPAAVVTGLAGVNVEGSANPEAISNPTESMRIKESAGQDIMPYQTAKEFSEKQGVPLDMSESQWKQHTDQQINQYVEPPVQPLVRKVLQEGNRPFDSNAYGPGEKGVRFKNQDGGEGFYPLNETNSTPQQ
jgi:hypothetical protein